MGEFPKAKLRILHNQVSAGRLQLLLSDSDLNFISLPGPRPDSCEQCGTVECLASACDPFDSPLHYRNFEFLTS
jgi:hypothetical protein